MALSDFIDANILAAEQIASGGTFIEIDGARISLRGFPARLSFRCEEVKGLDGSVLILEVILYVTERNSGFPDMTRAGDSCDLPPGQKRILWVVDTIRKLVKKILEHEVDECLVVNGERIFDPHEAERKFGQYQLPVEEKSYKVFRENVEKEFEKAFKETKKP